MNTKLHLTGFLLLFALSVMAQSPKWEVGPFLGVSTYQGDLIETDFYDFNELHLAYGLLVRHNFHQNLSWRANLLRGKISGEDANYDPRVPRNYAFSSPLTEASLLLEYDILGHKRNQDGQFKKIISPYVFIGVGGAWLDQNVSFNGEENDGDTDINADLNSDLDRAWFALPFGAGVKIDLTDRLNLG